MHSWFYNNILVSLLQGGSRLVLSIHVNQILFLPTTNWLTTSSNAQSPEFCLYFLLMFCPDEDCSPAVETLAFDEPILWLVEREPDRHDILVSVRIESTKKRSAW